ncbi:MAG: hypothetical protein GWN61_07285, partial [candidate division Zixibacteria bacterium]|nr:YceI family protein [candidate division Zixibacteria bacterium]NIS45808.1 YceI family protein [candidate division Zixibacteria bacterium]NIU13927.1 YceI family protein [candidate division Zixibacteria bacterium]NIV05979.1 hypothetical protein [candidate division Zixibacteria bacterium]NIW44735.1 hypothetical protein [Gammaproteobacteria bacterium]
MLELKTKHLSARTLLYKTKKIMAKISTIAIWALLLIHFCEAKEFIVDQSKDNKVMFFANATLSNFSGETSHLTGHLSWDGDDTLSTSEVAFEVPLDSLDTGIGLRNHHMREKYLHTDKYPTARYRGKLVEWNAQSDSLFLVKTKGTLSIHGVDQPLTETVKMRQLKDGYRAH